MTDANHNQTGYTYDKHNRRVTRADGLTKSESYGLRRQRQPDQYTDRRGTVDAFSYDGINRRTFAGFGYNGSSYQDTIGYTWDGATG